MGTLFSRSQRPMGRSIPSPPRNDDLVSANIHGIRHQWFGRRASDILPIQVEHASVTCANDLPVIGLVLDGAIEVRTSGRECAQLTFSGPHENSRRAAKLKNLAGIRLYVIETSS